MSKIKIDNENIFLFALNNGINLFTGAGFSVLESPSGNVLPTAAQLSKELVHRFGVNAKYGNDLEKLSSILKLNSKSEFFSFLREKFTIAANDYNSLYDALKLINIKSIITTNIDNIIPSIFDTSDEKYLIDINRYGPIKQEQSGIKYIPLHGDVTDLEREFYFGKFELCNVPNRGNFSMMESELLSSPTLFWGYGFHDGTVSAVISKILENGNQNIWVQLRSEDDADFFRDIGCNVIIADTCQLLDYIKEEAKTSNTDTKSFGLSEKIWKDISIPSINQVEALAIDQFYTNGKTHWYHILSKKVYITSIVNRIINDSFVNKNIIVVGIPLGGKTVILMQVACNYKKQVYYVDNLNQAKARMLCNSAIKDGMERIVIVDNCADDILAYKMLTICDNIRVIGACDEFQYESSKHLLEGIDINKIIIGDIDKNEANRIFESISKNLRNDHFVYKKKDTDKYSILELMSENIKGYLSKDRVKEIMSTISQKDIDTFELILLTTYLSFNKSALNTDVLISYYSLKDVDAIKKKIAKVQSFLSEYDVSLDPDANDQDYFTLRSNLFVNNFHEIARKNYQKVYSRVVSKFIEKVPMHRIYKNYVFKRKAFDSDLFMDLFPNNGEDMYLKLYENDKNAYTLQQLALYMARKEQYSQAFSYIDSALQMQPNNFSIKNARAIILFEANKEKYTSDAIDALKEAMDILEQCYNSDKRKIYHAQKYAEFAIFLFQSKKLNDYLKQALLWLKETIDNDQTCSRKTKYLLQELMNCCNDCNT